MQFMLLLLFVFWQLVPVIRWECCQEETRVIQAQDAASANASSKDTTAISVGYVSTLTLDTFLSALVRL